MAKSLVPMAGVSVEKDPTVALMLALNRLHAILFGTSGLRLLSEQRESRMEADRGYRTLRNKFVAQEMPVMEGLAKIQAMDAEDAAKAVPYVEPMVALIRDHLVKAGCDEVKVARAAMEAGGARNVDLALNPGSHTHRIQLGEHLEKADTTLSVVEMKLGMPNATFKREADTLDRVGSWLHRFERRISESNGALRGARNQSGPPSPAAAHPATLHAGGKRSSDEPTSDQIGALLASMVAVDDKLMSLGTRVQSLATRGAAANTHALTVEVQDRLRGWVNPILNHLNDAEAASNGIGPLLNGLVSDPLIWEVDTRLAIRSLKENLTAFIYSNGSEHAETVVSGTGCELYARGLKLQAAYEANEARRAVSENGQNGEASDSHTRKCEWRSASWLVKAVHKYSKGAATLKAKELSRAAHTKDIPAHGVRQRNRGRPRRYDVLVVCKALGLQQYERYWLTAIAEGFQAKRRRSSGPRKTTKRKKR